MKIKRIYLPILEPLKWVLSHVSEERMRKCQETEPVWIHFSQRNSYKDFAERPWDLWDLDKWWALRYSAVGNRRVRGENQLVAATAPVEQTTAVLSVSHSPPCGGLARVGGAWPERNHEQPPERVTVGKKQGSCQTCVQFYSHFPFYVLSCGSLFYDLLSVSVSAAECSFISGAKS